LLRGSFVPPQAVRDLRDLTRTRKALIRERGDHVNRIAKTLELANVKLGCVVTDILGKTGRAILEALIAGVTEPAALAALARGSLKDKQAALREAVVGRMTPTAPSCCGSTCGSSTCWRRTSPVRCRIEAAMACSPSPTRCCRRCLGWAPGPGHPGRGGGHAALPHGGPVRLVGPGVRATARRRNGGRPAPVGADLAAGDRRRWPGRRSAPAKLLPGALPPLESAQRRQHRGRGHQHAMLVALWHGAASRIATSEPTTWTAPHSPDRPPPLRRLEQLGYKVVLVESRPPEPVTVS
jgi:hypothetical protein